MPKRSSLWEKTSLWGACNTGKALSELKRTDPAVHRSLSEIVGAAGDIGVMVFCGVAKLMKGMAGNPHDLDLLVEEKKLSLLDGRLAKYRLAPPSLSDNGFFSGTLARYRIGGIDVDISGGILAKGVDCDLLLEMDSGLVSYARRASGNPLVMPLEEQFLFDSVRRDKPEKAGALLEHFRRQRPDLEFLKKRMELHNIPGQVRVGLLAAVGGE